MSITLKNRVSGSEVALPPELFWTDEFMWNKVKGTNTPTITGAQSIQLGVMQAGRPITLTAPPDMCWIERSLLEILYEWAEMPNLKMDLTLAYEGMPEREFIVLFDHSDNPVQAEPISGYESPKPTDEFKVTLKFMETSA